MGTAASSRAQNTLPAQNTQPAQNDDGLGRGKRTKKQTAKAQASTDTLPATITAPAPSNTRPHGPAVAAPAQPRAPTQAQVQPQHQAQPQNTQAQPQTPGPTLLRSTRTRARNQGTASIANHPGANNTPWQPNNSGQGNSPAESSSSPSSVRKSSRRKVPQIRINALMIKIYEEIHRAALDDLGAQSYPVYDAREFLFQVRLRRFLDLLAGNQRLAVENQLMAYNIHDFRAGAVVGDAQRAMDFPEPDRLKDFCNDPKLLLLTFCAHSPSFRDAIRRSDADSTANGLPYWSDIFALIKECTSSLELFARSHEYDWESHLRVFEKHFDTVLKNVYTDDQKTAGGVLDGVHPWNFGIAEGDLDKIHNIPDDEESHIHHHWALPKEDKQPAIRPSIQYTVTRDMWRAPFVNDFYAIADRPKSKNRKRPAAKTFVTLPVDSRQTMKQLDIIKSVFLDPSNHQWPNGDIPDNVIGLHDFCGAPGFPCVACGMSAPDPVNANPEDDMVIIDDDGTGKAAKPPKPVVVVNSDSDDDDSDDDDSADDDSDDDNPKKEPKPTYPCHCTLRELMAKHNKPGFRDPDDLLVELFTTKDKGRGVRSLQHIPKGTYIGIYVGEIYPERDPNSQLPIDRYGPPEGNCYHFSVSIGPPPHPARDRPMFTIDSAHLGNWTRLMNHSCNANVYFHVVNLGQRWTVVCQTTKEIKFRDQVTTDYGPDYFYHLELNCQCGFRKCKYKNVTKTLEKRRKRAREEEEDESNDEDERPAKRSGLNTKVARGPPAQPVKKSSGKRTGAGKGKGTGKAAKKGGKKVARRR